MAEINSVSLCLAKVWHKRLRLAVNSFSYRVFYLCFDVAEVEKLRLKFLSLDSFNLFSFYHKDHGKRDGSSLEAWIREILAQKNLDKETKKIFLFTHPRILGYVFNPVSFWFCLDEKENLIAVLCEVNNTFGEHHNYLIFNSNHAPIQQNQWFSACKEFHVSPFFEVKGEYKFRFLFNEKKVAAWINYFLNSEEKSLETSVISERRPLSDLGLLQQFLAIPLMTMKVFFLIHYQALKLVVKKIKYIPKPRQKPHRLTINS